MKYMSMVCLMVFTAALLFAQIDGREYEEIGSPKELERVLKHFPEGAAHAFHGVPMRDGIRLATDVFLPPGNGPWPVIFVRGFYGRYGTAGYARPCKDGQFVFVIQDARGRGDSEGAGTFDASSLEGEIHDCYDALEWLAGQSWCNGRIGMIGGSGNGVGPNAAFLSGHPNLVVAAPGNSSATAWYWTFDNRVRRWLYQWMKHRGMDVKAWPRPTLTGDSRNCAIAQLRKYETNPNTVYMAGAGWFDIVGESALDYFAARSDTSRMFVTVNPITHGGKAMVDGQTFPSKPKKRTVPAFENILLGESVSSTSFVQYYLMGDVHKPDGPGNEWRVTETWPVPHTDMPFYFTPDGQLADAPRESGRWAYAYDPRDPAPAIGGHATYGSDNVGPLDQRPLQERNDVLRFASAPLDAPLEITGNVFADLYFSTDVKDTLFIVKLVDIYPDGYEAILRESAGMGRYAKGLDGKTPLEKNEVYHLHIDLWSTAVVFDKGHRVGVYVTSSSAFTDEKSGKFYEVYEIHPNTFEPADSFSDSPVAHQVIHCGKERASRVILPVIR